MLVYDWQRIKNGQTRSGCEPGQAAQFQPRQGIVRITALPWLVRALLNEYFHDNKGKKGIYVAHQKEVRKILGLDARYPKNTPQIRDLCTH